MTGLCSLWRHRGNLSTLFLLVVALAVDGAILCEDTAGLLQERDRSENMPSECVLSCTAQTYGRMLQRQDTRTVRFRASDEGKTGEYCWSRRISCTAGESLMQAYVVMPTHTLVLTGEGPELYIVSVTHKDILKPHRGETPLADDCGPRFDVMGYFSRSRSEATFCVKMEHPGGTLGEALRCPPFLVSVWQNKNPSPVSHSGG